MNLKGKKILVLGANAETIPIVLKAQKMGVYVIVTDYIINSPAKLIADEYYDIDGKDIELIVDVIKKREVDGVMIGVADPLISSYVEICERMRFPCLLSKTAIDFFSNKSLFKNTCIRYKLPVIKELFSCSEFGQINKNNISYPIVVKPAKCRGAGQYHIAKERLN